MLGAAWRDGGARVMVFCAAKGVWIAGARAGAESAIALMSTY